MIVGTKWFLSNLHASIGRWDNVENLRKIMKGQGTQNILGCSSIVFEKNIHEFISGDKSHPRYAEINDKLEELGVDGCCWIFGKMEVVFYHIDKEEKLQVLGHHSEKLAKWFEPLK